jgi:ketosteroid isomerase-like protein
MSNLKIFPGRRTMQIVLALLGSMAILLAMSSPAAQKDKKKKKDAPVSDGQPIIPMTDEQQIDYMISGMLGAWQMGDVDRLHQSYADDVTLVNGTWAPPIIGWANYVASYKQQRAQMQQVRMDRSNTYIKVDGLLAWACYQWDFQASVDGQQSVAQGQTTLVLEKRNAKWLIVHNHTSLVPAAQPQSPPAATPASGAAANAPTAPQH